ncbi:arginine--tRNA ligase, partial [Erysipelothrix rhusiopathiae]|nr:arginine--tRNA ligase [Erysipelothrix rhusiopathiae]
MNKIETKLVGHIEDIILDAFGIEKEDGLVMLEIPNNPEMGDYSTNIAMRLTKRVGKNPREIAGVIVEKLEDNEMVESISIAGPGFINFVMKPAVLGSVVNDVIEAGKDYGRSNAGEGIRLLNEYVSANPTGQLHVGHARGAAWGDSLSRIMSFAGYDVLREYYINDLGNQILMLSHSLYARYKQAFGMEAPLPEDGYHGPDIIEIANDVKESEGDKWLSAPEEEWVPYFKELGIKLELERIKEDLNTFG